MDKQCLKCGEIKSAAQFRATHCNADGVEHFCKHCASTHNKQELIFLGSKICNCCGEELPRTDFRKVEDRSGARLLSSCNKCYKVFAQAKRINPSATLDDIRNKSLQKVCLKCYISKTIGHFKPCQANSDGRNHFCMQCEDEHPTEEVIFLGKKKCTKCRQEKARSEYNHSRDGLAPACKACSAESSRQYRRKDPEQYREYARKKSSEWRQKNPERAKAAGAKQRSSEDYRNKRREYAKTEKVKESDKNSRKKYSGELRDGYVLKSLMYQTGIPKQDLKMMEGVEHLIKVKRDLLKLKRVIKDKTINNGKD